MLLERAPGCVEFAWIEYNFGSPEFTAISSAVEHEAGLSPLGTAAGAGMQ